MTEVTFSGSDLASDLESFMAHLENVDASMTKILRSNLPLLEACSTEEHRKNLRPVFNGLVKDALKKLEALEIGGSNAPEAEPELSPPAPGVPPVPPQGHASLPRYFLTQLSVEGFRGIKNEGEPLVLKFDSQSVNSIFAQNGTGKSSLYEALQYAIQGKVARLESMQSNENADGYLANLFHSTGEATIGLILTPDDGTANVEVVVRRDVSGNRLVSSPTNHPDPEALLKSLNQDFTLLDYTTFTRFIEDTALNRGRSFSSLLGLSEYANFQRALKVVENTQTFRNDFGLANLEARKTQYERNRQALLTKFLGYYTEVTGLEISDLSTSPDWGQQIVSSLQGVVLISDELNGVTLAEVDFASLQDQVLEAEGGPIRQKLQTLMDDRSKLNELLAFDRETLDIQDLFDAEDEYESAVRSSRGEHIHRLNTAAEEFLRSDATWDDHVCPLCNSNLTNPIARTVNDTLESFERVTEASEKLRDKILNSVLLARLSVLEDAPLLRESNDIDISATLRSLVQSNSTGERIRGSLQKAQERLSVLETRLDTKRTEVSKEITEIEKQVPPSLVSLTAQISAAQSAQQALTEYESAGVELASVNAEQVWITRWKTFISAAHSAFSSAEADLSNKTLAALRGEYQQMFAEVMSAGDIVPELARPGTDEKMTVELTSFHGRQNVSARALLSESYRNALAISVFLCAAASHTKAPRFIVLDDATSSFDSGHQYHLMEQIRTKFQFPNRANGMQFILFSHDVALEKYFDRLGSEPGWQHQKLQGWPPLTPVTTHGQNPDRLGTAAERFLRAGQIDEGAGLIRQYLEFVLQQIIKKVRIPVPIDLAVNDHQKMVNSCIEAITYAVNIHSAAGQLILTPQQVADLKTHHAPAIIANWVSHYGTSGASSFSPGALLGVLTSINSMRRCFQYDNGSGSWVFYKSLTMR